MYVCMCVYIYVYIHIVNNIVQRVKVILIVRQRLDPAVEVLVINAAADMYIYIYTHCIIYIYIDMCVYI